MVSGRYSREPAVAPFLAWVPEAEISFAFTFAMMIARLASGTLASLCGGFAAAWISKANGTAIKVMGVLLIALFIPVHYGLWVKFPLWYHVAFLASLMPLVLLGAKLAVIFGHKALPQKRSEAP